MSRWEWVQLVTTDECLPSSQCPFNPGFNRLDGDFLEVGQGSRGYEPTGVGIMAGTGEKVD